jgi:hypothetical protein
MGTAPAGDGGTGCTPRKRECQSRRAGSAPRRTGPRSARTGAACYGSRTPEVQVGPGYPAPPFGPPVRQGARRAEVGGAAGAGQFGDVGGDPLQDRGHPWQAGHHQRLIGVIAVGAQVDRRGYWLVCRRVSQSAHWRIQPTSSTRRPQIRSRPSSSASSSAPGSSGPGQPAARSSPRATSSSARSAAAVIWCTRAGTVPPRPPACGSRPLPHGPGPAPKRAPARPDPGARPPAIPAAAPAVPAARPPSGR